MTKSDLIKAIAEKAGVSQKEAAKVLDATVDSITEALKSGEKVSITGFATFEAKTKAAHTAKSPATGAIVEVPEKRVPKITAGKSLKDAIL